MRSPLKRNVEKYCFLEDSNEDILSDEMCVHLALHKDSILSKAAMQTIKYAIHINTVIEYYGIF